MEIHLVFDGGNGASREKEAYGSFNIKTDNIDQIERVSFGIGYTNNEAEYMTLIAALEHLIDQYNAGDINLYIKGDSELVRNQIGNHFVISGSEGIISQEWVDVWQVKKKHLLPYRDKARELLKQFKSFTYIHAPRKEIVSILGH